MEARALQRRAGRAPFNPSVTATPTPPAAFAPCTRDSLCEPRSHLRAAAPAAAASGGPGWSACQPPAPVDTIKRDSRADVARGGVAAAGAAAATARARARAARRTAAGPHAAASRAVGASPARARRSNPRPQCQTRGARTSTMASAHVSVKRSPTCRWCRRGFHALSARAAPTPPVSTTAAAAAARAFASGLRSCSCSTHSA